MCYFNVLVLKDQFFLVLTSEENGIWVVQYGCRIKILKLNNIFLCNTKLRYFSSFIRK
jgi:hypothetical protein